MIDLKSEKKDAFHIGFYGIDTDDLEIKPMG